MALTLAAVTIDASTASEPDCKPQALVDVATIDRQIVLIGEVHGTNEFPRFTSGLVCSLLRSGRSVILGIEHSGEQQEALNRYLDSAGSPLDRQDLLKGINWRVYSDGRGSGAMFELVESMRRLRQRGQRVAVLAIDRNENVDVPLRADEKIHVSPADNALLNRIANVQMAHDVLYAAALFRQYTIVVLSGYSHTSTALALSNNPMIGNYRPMGQVISDEQPVFTIGIETDGGDHAYGSKTQAVDAGSLYDTGIHVDAMVHLNHLTPSVPARETVK